MTVGAFLLLISLISAVLWRLGWKGITKTIYYAASIAFGLFMFGGAIGLAVFGWKQLLQ